MNIKNKLKIIPLQDIKPYPKNAKIHSPEHVQLLKGSIKQYDYVEPIIVGTDNVIIGGHGRYFALKETDPDQQVEVVDASYLAIEAQRKLRILLNKSASQEYDKDALQAEIEALYDGLDDIEKIADELGISEKEINELMPTPETEGDDDIPEKAPAITKLGDLWELGRHRLLCGDSTKEEDVARLMDGKKADMVFTDPPYGINVVRNNSIGGSKPFGKNGFDGIVKAGNYKPIKGDDTTETAKKAIQLCLTKSNLCIFWGGNFYTDFLSPVRCWIIWDKETDGNFGDGEIAWSNANKSIRIFRHKWSGMLKASEKRDKRIHPTQKPIALAEWAFDEFQAKDKILDVFLGSGSTLIACEKTNRICYGMELDEHYCDVIVQRYIDFCTKNNINIEIKHNGEIYNANITPSE